MPRPRIRPVIVKIRPEELHEYVTLLTILAHEATQVARAAEPESEEALRLEERRHLLQRLLWALEHPMVRTLVQGSKRTGGGQ